MWWMVPEFSVQLYTLVQLFFHSDYRSNVQNLEEIELA